MSIYQIFIINRAGSLIYDWDTKEDLSSIEKTFSYPLDIVLDVVDSKIAVVFGERDGIALRYAVAAINGTLVKDTLITINGVGIDVLDYLAEPKNYPVNIRFVPPTITTNEKIILSSTFHSLFTIAEQLSPVPKSSGIEVLTTTQFRLQCFQSTTGIKFVVVGSPNIGSAVEKLLHRLYELFADYALKNAFYSIDMPIRCQRFDDAVKALIERHDNKMVSNPGNSMQGLVTRIPDLKDYMGHIIISRDTKMLMHSGGDLFAQEAMVEKVLSMVKLVVGLEKFMHTSFTSFYINYGNRSYSICVSTDLITIIKKKVCHLE